MGRCRACLEGTEGAPIAIGRANSASDPPAREYEDHGPGPEGEGTVTMVPPRESHVGNCDPRLKAP